MVEVPKEWHSEDGRESITLLGSCFSCSVMRSRSFLLTHDLGVIFVPYASDCLNCADRSRVGSPISCSNAGSPRQESVPLGTTGKRTV